MFITSQERSMIDQDVERNISKKISTKHDVPKELIMAEQIGISRSTISKILKKHISTISNVYMGKGKLTKNELSTVNYLVEYGKKTYKERSYEMFAIVAP